MRPTLQHKPSHYAYKDLLVKFADGKPLSCDQLNFLYRHERTLSHPQMDQVTGYYLKHHHHDYTDQHSFLMPSDTISNESVKKLKERLSIVLKNKDEHVQLKFTPEQFMQFKAVTFHELILYHGNQFLSGAPFYPGGIPHLIYFQWGNLFGVAKYVVMAEEKALKTNVLIYFEDMQERLLAECVSNYNRYILQKTPDVPVLKAPELKAPAPQPQASSAFKTPTLSLSQGSGEKEDKK